jgi:hypothetical protein
MEQVPLQQESKERDTIRREIKKAVVIDKMMMRSQFKSRNTNVSILDQHQRNTNILDYLKTYLIHRWALPGCL